MSTGHILLLGAIAGATIFLGLPVGRVNTVGPIVRACLSALATGILLFLFWDVLTGAVDPIDSALQARHWGRFAWLSGVGAAGFALGLMGLVHYAVWMRRRASRRVTTLVGPGAATSLSPDGRQLSVISLDQTSQTLHGAILRIGPRETPVMRLR